jgi:hypothetical protein
MRSAYAILLSAVLAAGHLPAAAAPAARPGGAGEAQARFRLAAADCYGIGQQVASQMGGTLRDARAATRGGQAVCVIVVLVPGRDGGRPRRQEIVVPQ